MNIIFRGVCSMDYYIFLLWPYHSQNYSFSQTGFEKKLLFFSLSVLPALMNKYIKREQKGGLNMTYDSPSLQCHPAFTRNGNSTGRISYYGIDVIASACNGSGNNAVFHFKRGHGVTALHHLFSLYVPAGLPLRQVKPEFVDKDDSDHCP